MAGRARAQDKALQGKAMKMDALQRSSRSLLVICTTELEARNGAMHGYSSHGATHLPGWWGQEIGHVDQGRIPDQARYTR